MAIDILYYLMTGAFAGFAAGLLGVGGGLVIVPVLFTIFSTAGFDAEVVMHMALATSLATIILTSLSSSYAHHRRGAVLWRTVLLLSPGIALGAWAGGALAATLNTPVLKPVFAVFELLVAIQLLARLQPSQRSYSIGHLKAFGAGSMIGGVSAIVGIGGGTLTVPFLNWHDVPMRKAIATSAACGLPIAVFATASYVFSGWDVDGLPAASFGFVYLPALLCIAITSLLCAPLGARVAHAVPERALRIGFGILLLLLGIRMLLS